MYYTILEKTNDFSRYQPNSRYPFVIMRVLLMESSCDGRLKVAANGEHGNRLKDMIFLFSFHQKLVYTVGEVS